MKKITNDSTYKARIVDVIKGENVDVQKNI